MATIQSLTATRIYTLTNALDARLDLVEAFETRLEALEALVGRSEVVLSSSSIALDVSENGAANLGKRSTVLAAEANRPCRIRFYGTEAERLADEDRPIGEDPTEVDGVLLELVFTAEMLEISPLFGPPDIYNLDDPVTEAIYWRVTNLDNTTGVVTVTLTIQKVE